MALASAQLLTGGSTTSASSYTTAGITTGVGINELAILTVYASGATAPASPTITTSNANLVFVLIQTVTFAARRLSVYRAMPASGAAGAGTTITINFGATATGVTYSLVRYTGASTAGYNGAGAIKQITTGGSASNTTALTITHPNPANYSSNLAHAAFGIDVFETGTAFTLVGAATSYVTNQSTPNMKLIQAMGNTDSSYTSNGMFISVNGTSTQMMGISVEIQCAGYNPATATTNMQAAGDITYNAASSHVATGETIRLRRVKARYSGYMRELSFPDLHLNAAGTVDIRALVYADNSGVPGKRLLWGNSQALTRTATGNSTTTVLVDTIVPQLWIEKDKWYWIGISSNDTSNLGVFISSSGTGTHYERTATGQHVSPPTDGSVFTSAAKDIDVTLGILVNTFGSTLLNRYRKLVKVNRAQVPTGSNFSGTARMASRRIFVNVTDPDLRSIENGGKVWNFANLYPSAGASTDISFMDMAGGGMTFDMISYDPTTGAVQASVITTNSNSSQFYLIYGRGWRGSANNGGALSPATVYSFDSGVRDTYMMEQVPDTNGATFEITDMTSSRNATSVNMTSANQVAGIVGKALTFNGTNQYLEVPYNASQPFTNGNMVLKVRVKFGAFPGSQTLVAQGNGAFRVDNISGTISLNLVKYGLVDQRVTWPGATTGVWYDIVAFQTTTQVAYYVNGALVGTFANSSNFTASTTNFRIGADAGTAQNYLNGTIDEVQYGIDSTYNADIALLEYNIYRSSTFLSYGAEEDAKKLYKVRGGTAMTSTEGWSPSSGGEVIGSTTPDVRQELIFDANSWNAPATFTVQNTTCQGADFSGINQNITIQATGGVLTVNGALTLSSLLNTDRMFLTLDPPVSTTYDLTGRQFDTLLLGNPSSSAPVLSTISITGNFNARGRVTIQNAIINLSGKSITTPYFNGRQTASIGSTLNLTNATITISRGLGASWNGETGEFYSQPAGAAGMTATGASVIFENDGYVAGDKFFYSGGVPFGTIRLKQGSLDLWFPAGHQFLDNLIIDAGAWLKVEPDPQSTAPTNFIKISTAFTAVGTSGNRVKLTNYDAGVPAYLAPNGSPTITVDYADITDLGVNGAYWQPGANSTLSGTTTGWAASQTVLPATFDNAETVSDSNQLNMSLAPLTIGRNTTVDGLYVISNMRRYIVPDAIPTVQFGAIFISNFERTIDTETINRTISFSDTAVIFNKTSYLKPDTIIDKTKTSLPVVQGALAANDTAPSYDFYARSVRNLRDIAAAVTISFERQYDADASLYVVGSSAFDMGAVWRGNGSTIQEWDKFDYSDYTDYLSSFEYHSEQDILGGMVLSMADITLNNYSNMFSPYGSSPLAPFILPNRPIRLYAGYTQLLDQIFVGQTLRLPETSKESAKFHAVDFIGSFADIELTAGRIYTNMYTDDIVDDLLQNVAGLSPTQYSLDAGQNLIGFINFTKGTKVGEAIRDLMQAELGRLYQEADGAIVFNNRLNKTRPTAITLREEYVYSQKEPDQSNVINRVKINADVRQVQSSRQVFPTLKNGSLSQYEDFQAFLVPAGASVEKFFNFNDPVTSFTHPTVGGGITANSAQDGSGANRNADLTRAISAVFTDSVKYTFTNTSGTDLYVTACTIQGTPATVVKEIRIDLKDQPSIDKYGEKLIEIDNDCFTSSTFATTIAQAIIDQNKDAPSIREMTVKGLPYMHVGDVIKHYDGQNYVIDQLSGKHSPANGHTQTIRARLVP